MTEALPGTKIIRVMKNHLKRNNGNQNKGHSNK